ncbi:hypothetical protein ACFSS8_08385 [Paracoccus kondratievae]
MPLPAGVGFAARADLSPAVLSPLRRAFAVGAGGDHSERGGLFLCPSDVLVVGGGDPDLSGGWVFAYAYVRRGFPAAWVLHAVAGNVLFAVGMGVYFYSGNVVRPF